MVDQLLACCGAWQGLPPRKAKGSAAAGFNGLKITASTQL